MVVTSQYAYIWKWGEYSFATWARVAYIIARWKQACEMFVNIIDYVILMLNVLQFIYTISNKRTILLQYSLRHNKSVDAMT